jgi:hypothetical protein
VVTGFDTERLLACANRFFGANFKGLRRHPLLVLTMPKSLCLLVPLLLLSPSVTAEIFKCPGENGKIIYQNFRCELDSIGSEATATDPEDEAPVPVVQPTAPPVRPKVTTAGVANSSSSAGVPKEPRFGMTTEQVRASSWGPPLHITTAEGEEGVEKRWSYGGTRAVLFNRRGRVVAIEH